MDRIVRGALIAAAVTALAVAAAPAAAQSLVEAARKEADRRSGISAPGKSYTNADLKPDPARPPGAVSARASAPPPVAGPGKDAAGNASADAPTNESPPPPDAPPVDEQTWRRMADAIRHRLDAALKEQAEMKGAPATASDRENQRIASAQRRANAAVASLEEEWRRFELRAETAKVPKAWIH